MKIVVFSPHPDDEVIGCGGSLIKHARAGCSITVVTLGERLGCLLESDLTEADYRAEAKAAHTILGVRRHVDLALPSRTLVATRDLVLRLVRELRAEQPDIVYLPHDTEVDAEHRETSRAASEAVWMAQSVYFEDHGPPMAPPRWVLGYEVWTPLSRYQYVEDISETIDDKVRAMECYASQQRHGDWAAALKGLARYRGVSCGGGSFAEVFTVVHVSGAVGSRVRSAT
jgi:N-acetylglucosamine malate deacetylase 1